MPDYTKGKIYKIVCNITGLIYVGSTCEPTLARRLAEHLKTFKQWKNGQNKSMTSYKILENGNYDIILLETYACQNKDELHKRERYYIETLSCVNKRIEGRTRKEWYETNKDILLQKQKNKYIENKECFASRAKAYREKHSEKIKSQKNEKYECECGGKYTTCHKQEHYRSKKHQAYVNSQK